ncbi:PREDICTED: uncharacterized protein LOC109359733 [Lupinus angustifolius]|uniref:uncharacterized protein LOC109359733 n=1 Tax=Lupinus angustifolius TaxID=3871 RepID=UPI00092F06AB|nr:PREDICTED: uncharacterized protein LOC109359733 [Lupinus angustifolius]
MIMKNLAFPPTTDEVIDVETFHITQFSLKGTHKSIAILIDLSDSDNDQNDDVRILTSKPPNTPFGKRKRIFEIGKSSNANNNNTITPFICPILMYVESKIQENVVKIRCPKPECEVGLLELQRCRGILPKEVFDRWGDALCEAKILENKKLYFPYKDCSALMVNDGGELMKLSEFTNCRRLFYAQCKVT